jgi:hypothetical protein
VPVKRIAREMGRLNCSLRKLISTSGGIRPRPRIRCALHLSFDEREEISRGAGRRTLVSGHRAQDGPGALDHLEGGERQRRTEGAIAR